jgi:hypothetical protein
MAKRNVFKDAKKIRSQHPRKFKTWAEYVSYASSHAPRKKKSMPKRKAAPRKKHRPAARQRARPRRRIAGESGVSTRSRTHTDYNRNKVNITVGAVKSHTRIAREKLEHLIGNEEVKKFKAPLKRVKKKIQKKITSYKAAYRRLCAKI